MSRRRDWAALVIRAQVTTDPASEVSIAELVSARLDDFSPLAVEDLAPQPLPPGGLWDPTFPALADPPPTPIAWRVFFTCAADRDSAARALADAGLGLDIGHIDVADQDWAARSQQDLKAIVAGSFIVAPPWDVPPRSAAGGTLIVIEPSRGFGTGHHASTRLCLRALSEVALVGKRVLDLGTGSGVLAIAASLSGAREVMAVDVDPDAVEAAHGSIRLNPAARGVAFHVGDFRDRAWTPLQQPGWDVLLANLTGGMLMASAARIRDLVVSGGTIIVSGFDEAERADVEAGFGMVVSRMLVEDGWVGLVLMRSRAKVPRYVRGNRGTGYGVRGTGT